MPSQPFKTTYTDKQYDLDASSAEIMGSHPTDDGLAELANDFKWSGVGFPVSGDHIARWEHEQGEIKLLTDAVFKALTEPDSPTVYDTGETAQPHPWIDANHKREDHGNVDFDDDGGFTLATVQVARDDNGKYTMHVHRNSEYLKVQIHDD